MIPPVLRVSEIFFSLQGESTRSGLPTVFIRLTGCPLRCDYCDTRYAYGGGENMHLDAILAEVSKHSTCHVCVTGGEPLAQESSFPLLTALCDAGYSVSLETSGALDVAAVDARVCRVLDIKTPGSGEAGRNLWTNLTHIRPYDEIKFVLCDEPDYAWAKGILREYRLHEKCPVLFSPVTAKLAPRDLAEWILRDGLPVRMQLQLHKLIWGEERGR